MELVENKRNPDERQVKLRPSPAITDEQSDAEDVEEVRGI